MITITTTQMENMFPGSGRFAGPISDTCNKFKITNPAMFISQIGEETGGLKVFSENLHYSADRLLQIFPYYFNDNNVDAYDNNPQIIANRVYGNRMGNGPESSGDGYLYRGRGAIQLTGKWNYQKFSDAMGMTLPQVIDFITTDEGAIMSAGWYWSYANVNPISQDIVATTKRINGGLINLATRQTIYNKAVHIFPTNVTYTDTPIAPPVANVVAPVIQTVIPPAQIVIPVANVVANTTIFETVANFGYSLYNTITSVL